MYEAKWLRKWTFIGDKGTIAESINTLSVEKIHSRVATKLHYFSIFFYNKRQKLNNSGNTFHSCSFVNACTQAAMLGACKSVYILHWCKLLQSVFLRSLADTVSCDDDGALSQCSESICNSYILVPWLIGQPILRPHPGFTRQWNVIPLELFDHVEKFRKSHIVWLFPMSKRIQKSYQPLF